MGTAPTPAGGAARQTLIAALANTVVVNQRSQSSQRTIIRG
jgi:hypothetical protein